MKNTNSFKVTNDAYEMVHTNKPCRYHKGIFARSNYKGSSTRRFQDEIITGRLYILHLGPINIEFCLLFIQQLHIRGWKCCSYFAHNKQFGFLLK